MTQDPRITVGWALNGLEAALRSLGDGPAERRVRGQFHQLMLALERERRILRPAVLESSDSPESVPADTPFQTEAPTAPEREDNLDEA